MFHGGDNFITSKGGLLPIYDVFNSKQMCSSLARPKLEFISAVDSNDALYGGDAKFLAEINKLSETVVSQILDHLKTLGKEEVCSYSA